MKEVKRPWGNFKQFILNKKCTVKIITIKPKQELSLQLHKNRSETWYFFTDGIVQIKNKKIRVKKNNIINVPKKTPHRVISTNKETMFLEISSGKFDEKDETRLEDKYGRK